MPNPLPIGTEVPPWGKIQDVWEWPLTTTGEVRRTYLLRSDQGLRYLPAAVVERGKEVVQK